MTSGSLFARLSHHSARAHRTRETILSWFSVQTWNAWRTRNSYDTLVTLGTGSSIAARLAGLSDVVADVNAKLFVFFVQYVNFNLKLRYAVAERYVAILALDVVDLLAASVVFELFVFFVQYVN